MLNLDTSFFNLMVSDDSNLSPTEKYRSDHFRNRINGYAESFRRQDGFKELQHEYGKFARLARKLIKEEGLVQQNKNEVDAMLKNLAHAMQSYRQSPNEYDYITLRQELFLRDSDLHHYNDCAVHNIAQQKRYEENVDELNSKYGMDIPKFPFDYCTSTEQTKVRQLLKDAKAGKSIHYEFSDDFQYYDDDGLKKLASLGIKFPDIKIMMKSRSIASRNNIANSAMSPDRSPSRSDSFRRTNRNSSSSSTRRRRRCAGICIRRIEPMPIVRRYRGNCAGLF